jgi:hypothetical protein
MADKKVIAIEIKVTEKNAARAVKTTKKAVDGLADSTERLSRANNKNRAQSGLNNAILIETGRVASDAAYGIQGVANNIGRLLELGQEFSRTSGKGLGGALSQLGKSLLGVGGVIVGVQLLLSFLPRIQKAFLKWAGAVTSVNKALKDATEVYGEQIGRLETYVEMLNDSNVSDEQKAIILKKVSDEHEGLNLQLDETNKLTDDSIVRTEILIKVLMKKAQSQAILNEIQEKYIEQFKLQNASLVESTGFLEVFQGILSGATDGLAGVNSMVAASAKSRTKELSTIADDIDKLQEKLKEFGIFPDDSDGLLGGRLRAFKQKLLDLSKLEERFRQQSELTFILNEEERIIKQQEFSLRDLDIRVQQFKDREKLRLEEFEESSRSDEKKAEAKREYLESIRKADEEAADVRIQIFASTETKLLKLEADQSDKRFDSNRKKQELEVLNLKYSLDANQYYLNEKMALLQSDIDFENFRLKTARLSVDERAEGELKLAQLEQQLNETKLQQKLDFIKENQRIDLIYVGFAQQTSDLLSNIAGENEAMQKAALLIEKGAAVADIVVRTQSSNQIIRAGYSAKAALAPVGGAAFKAIAQAEITRNNIGAALSIANILATTISSFKQPSAGGQGGGGNVEAPDFNVVGASPESQLAQTVATSQKQPLRAFVVHKDIVDAGEVYENIIDSAST